MSTQENEAIVRRLIAEGYNAGNMAVFDELYAPDYVEHNPSLPRQATGPGSARLAYTAYRAAFPDGRYTIDDLIAGGDRVVARMTFSGTHLGSFAGVAPTGRPVTMMVVDIWRLAGGKIAEGWHLEDDLGLMQQLDIVPAIGLVPAEM